MIKITLNGHEREFEEKTLSVREMIQRVGLGDVPVLVERNGEALLPREFEGQIVRDGDVIEIVRMVAGG